MYLAVDIGGTKTLVALFSKRGRVLRRHKFKTSWQKERFVRDLMRVLGGFTKFKLTGVVVAVPGVVQKNCSIRLGNRDWGTFSLVNELSGLFDCPIYFENDANLASVYESQKLPGKTVFLTFSTGIGGGIAERGRILPESDDFEPGHKIYPFGGKKLEWEDIAASSALEKAFHVDSATDLRGKKTMMEIAERVYLGIPDIVSKYQPDTIILGGPLGKIFNLYVKYLPKVEGVRYRRPRRPLESVIYGCYLFGKNQKWLSVDPDNQGKALCFSPTKDGGVWGRRSFSTIFARNGTRLNRQVWFQDRSREAKNWGARLGESQRALFPVRSRSRRRVNRDRARQLQRLAPPKIALPWLRTNAISDPWRGVSLPSM